MATEMHWWNGSTWKKANEMYVWNGGEWKQTVRMYIFDTYGSYTWRLCHESAGFCQAFDGASVMCSACGNCDGCDTIGACGIGVSSNAYSSNCADPYQDYSTNNCYLYNGSACGTIVSDEFIQILIGVTYYNVDTDTSGKITNMATVTC